MYFTGCGVFAKADIPKGEFLTEYVGELITEKEGLQRLKIGSGPGYLFFINKHW